MRISTFLFATSALFGAVPALAQSDPQPAPPRATASDNTDPSLDVIVTARRRSDPRTVGLTFRLQQ